MRDILKSHYKSVGKFTLVGISNTLIDFLVFTVLHELFGMYFVFAHILGFMTAITNSFYFNATWTFKKLNRDKLLKQVVSFVTVGVFGLIFSTTTIYFASFFLWVYFAKALASLVSFAWNYTASSIFVFKD